MRAASPEGAWWLWRRGGGAWASARAEIAEAAAAAGLARDFAGAVEFSPDEVETMMRIVRAFAVWPWGAPDDLYLVPQDRSCVVMICHDEEIHVHAANPGRLEAYRRVLSGVGGESRD